MPTTKKATEKKSTSVKKAVSSEKKDTSVSAPSASSKKKMTVGDARGFFKKKEVLFALGIIVLLVIAYFAKGLFVAATVNNQPISRIEVIKQLEKQSGKQVVETMVTRALIEQEAAKKNINITQKDIDAETKRIESQFKEQGQDLNSLLQSQGITRDQFEDEVKVQVTVQKILGDSVKLSDQEFNQALEQYKETLAEEENQEAAKKTLRGQLEQQKLAQKYQEWIAELRKNAQVNYFVSY